MKRAIVGILALLLVPSASFAVDAIPAGCYVADYERTDPCYGEDLTWTDVGWNSASRFSGEQDFRDYYGLTVAAIINTEAYYESRSVSLTTKAVKQDKLIKRLKAKCGSRCSGIR